jgi:23S rRNA (adenine2503-C2)-methyltransferase
MDIRESQDGTKRVTYRLGYSSVIVPTKNDKVAVCVSCMIGCPLGCEICHTGDYRRKLTAEEMLDQVLDAKRIAGKVTSVVFMGMGEPMLNFEEVSRAIVMMNEKLQLPYRRITLSTIGINLPRLKQVRYQVAVSLHSPYDDIRMKLIPKSGPIDEIVEFTHGSDRGIMLAYAMIDGVNDREEDLIKLLSYDWEKRTNFNLIEFNDCGRYKKSDKLEYFKQRIVRFGYKCFIRQSRGKDIGAACGMLEISDEF